jgi:ASC-1-like (ASCH) protein
MIDILKEVMRNYAKVAPHANKIKENKLRIYELSKELPNEQGLELIQLHDSSVEEIRKMHKKLHERNNWKEE